MNTLLAQNIKLKKTDNKDENHKLLLLLAPKCVVL